MEFQGKVLDPFQVEAARAIDANESVVVSAPTGSGKTLIAEYAIHRLFAGQQRAIYTAPIKALSNQKFRDFKATMGDKIGIITGDVVINDHAQVLIMTTEIYRNILFSDPASLDDVKYVVFDEVHYINDIERGTIWEESIIFSPHHIRFCFLSATIPNARQFAAWVQSLHGHPVRAIEHHERPVPLEHFLYEHTLGLVPWEHVYKFPFDDPRTFKTVSGRDGRKRRKYHAASHLSLVGAIKDQLPCLFFVFSRAGCEEMACAAAEHFDFTTAAEKEEIRKIMDECLAPVTELERLATIDRVRHILPRGIGIHHAGLLPAVKEAVEVLFAKGLIRLLYATETFAVGINMPARSVAFNSLRKFDGHSFGFLTLRQYYQMAGRAGRRGMDQRGTVVTLGDMNELRPEEMPHYNREQAEDLLSQFDLSYNSVLNLHLRFKSEEEVRQILRNNFSQFLAEDRQRDVRRRLEELKGQLPPRPDKCAQGRLYTEFENLLRLEAEVRTANAAAERRHGRNRRRAAGQAQQLSTAVKRHPCAHCAYRAACLQLIRKEISLKEELLALREELRSGSFILHWSEFKNKTRLLTRLGFIDQGGLTPRGKFATQINGYELLAGEMMFNGLLENLDEPALAALACACAYEARPRVSFTGVGRKILPANEIKQLIRRIRKAEYEAQLHSEINFDERAGGLGWLWATGTEFMQVAEHTSISEGDIIQLFRRGVDFLRQLRGAATGYGEFRNKMARAMDLLYRDIVVVKL